MLKCKFLIVIEGVDGSGKTTQVKKLLSVLMQKGYKVNAIGRRFLLSTLYTLIFGTDIVIADRYTPTTNIFFGTGVSGIAWLIFL